MIEEILPRLFRIEIPLPDNPLKVLNSYVITGHRKNLIVDTGLNHPACLNAMHRRLKELSIDLGETDFFITHYHADHIGLLGRLAMPASMIYFNESDASLISAGGLWDHTIDFHTRYGFPMDELQEFLDKEPVYKYFEKGDLKFTCVRDGDEISAGDYRFTCVSTPGHTGGHMCLYEDREKLLIGGDHILDGITPNISQWFEHTNPLDSYLMSLDRTAVLDIDILLPGHRNIVEDTGKRIRELKRHHAVRADDICSILGKNEGDALHVASQMRWDLSYDSWDKFPVFQKWFAFGEAVAHLTYLEANGKIRKNIRNRKMIFEVK